MQSLVRGALARRGLAVRRQAAVGIQAEARRWLGRRRCQQHHRNACRTPTSLVLGACSLWHDKLWWCFHAAHVCPLSFFSNLPRWVCLLTRTMHIRVGASERRIVGMRAPTSPLLQVHFGPRRCRCPPGPAPRRPRPPRPRRCPRRRRRRAGRMAHARPGALPCRGGCLVVRRFRQAPSQNASGTAVERELTSMLFCLSL